MEHKLNLMLVVPVLAALIIFADGDQDSGHAVEYRDVLTIFGEIADPYDKRKTARNQETDRQVDNIIDQIQSIIPELTTLHKEVHNLTSGVPLLQANVQVPLLKVKDGIRQTVLKLLQCANTQTSYDFLLPKDSSAASSETEESESESPAGHSTSIEHEERENPEESEASVSALADLITPDTIDESALNTILGRYDQDSFVTLRDAAKAFKTVADLIAQEHRLRFLGLVPKIRKVKDNIGNILHHVTKASQDIAEVTPGAANFYLSTVRCVQYLTNLTTKVLDIPGQVC